MDRIVILGAGSKNEYSQNLIFQLNLRYLEKN